MKRFLLAWFCVAALLVTGAFVGFEISAGLAAIVCIGALLARLQGKGRWAVSDVVRDILSAILRLLTHLRWPQRIVDRRKSILALMAVLGLTAILLPPWISETNNRLYHRQEFDGYAFVLVPPSKRSNSQSTHIDYGRLGLEFVTIFLTGGLLLLLSGPSESLRSSDGKLGHDEVQQLLQAVVEGFHGVANKRGESLSEAELKRICTFFYHQQQTYGPEFTREHLEYELKRYECEGLRGDYRA